MVKRFFTRRGMGQVITVTVGLAILFIVFSFMNSNFSSPMNVSNLLRQIVPFLIVGIGQSYVLITGNIDLSIGSVLGMSCMISATLMTKGVNPWLAVLITFICCIAVGVINGELVARCKLPPFIATLGTMTVARGIAQIANGNYNTGDIGSKVNADLFRDIFYRGTLFKIGNFSFYHIVWITILLWVIFNFILNKTRLGRHIYAVGSNVEAAKLSGVNVISTTTKTYVVSAICACIAGLYTCATTGNGTMDAGNTYELYAVAASVIGGVSTLGGQGLLLGTVIGASIWGVLQNGLQFAGAPVALRNIIIGIIVVLAVLMDVVVRSGKFSFKRKAKSTTGGGTGTGSPGAGGKKPAATP